MKKILVIILIVSVALIFGLRVSIRETFISWANKAGIILKDNPKKVYLVQINPDSQGYAYRQEINLLKHPAVMMLKDTEQPFWLAIENSKEDRNCKNPILHLEFDGKVSVRVDKINSPGWTEWDPQHTYYIEVRGEIKPQKGISLGPIYLKFPKEGTYNVKYSLSADDESIIKDASFAISVKK